MIAVREDDPDLQDPVPVDLIGNQYETVLSFHPVSAYRQMPQLFNQISADGVIVIGMKIKMGGIIHIVQLHASRDQDLPVGYAADQIGARGTGILLTRGLLAPGLQE